MNRVFMLILGYFFLVLGVIGLVLPFLQGFLFIAVGLLILAKHAPWARRVLEWLKAKHPKLRSGIEAADEWSSRKGEQIRLKVGRIFRPAVEP